MLKLQKWRVTGTSPIVVKKQSGSGRHGSRFRMKFLGHVLCWFLSEIFWSRFGVSNHTLHTRLGRIRWITLLIYDKMIHHLEKYKSEIQKNNEWYMYALQKDT